MSRPTGADELARQRNRMVDRDIAGRGVVDQRVLEAMRSVPRHRFLPPGLAEYAYDDTPLPIAEGQTISQPYIVAAMTEALELSPGDRVLEIGTGSGYAAAVLGEIVDEVWTIERHRPLADAARSLLGDLGHDHVHVVCGDGTLGWAEQAPYDAIVVTAAAPEVPTSLLEQLAEGGHLVIPVGSEMGGQELIGIRRRGDEFDERKLGAVRFVPLIAGQGREGDTRSPRPRRGGSVGASTPVSSSSPDLYARRATPSGSTRGVPETRRAWAGQVEGSPTGWRTR